MAANHDDVMEGNAGFDQMWGGNGQDDMVGGSMIMRAPDVGDEMYGEGDDDVMLGDNGIITRPTGEDGKWRRLTGNGYDIVVRSVTMSKVPEPADAFGDDRMWGGAGHDEMYGQQGNDTMEGNGGDDALVGDLGNIMTGINGITNDKVEEEITTPPPFFVRIIFKKGTLLREVELYSFKQGDGAEGNDIMLGGADQDNLHGGPGADIMNGNAGEDHVFGGDGNDVTWGGPGDDHSWAAGVMITWMSALALLPRSRRRIHRNGSPTGRSITTRAWT